MNNASFGAYAEIVQSPEYRDNKKRTMLEMLPDLLSAAVPELTVRAGGTTLDRRAGRAGQQQSVRRRELRDMGRRARIDQGVLGWSPGTWPVPRKR